MHSTGHLSFFHYIWVGRENARGDGGGVEDYLMHLLQTHCTRGLQHPKQIDRIERVKATAGL